MRVHKYYRLMSLDAAESVAQNSYVNREKNVNINKFIGCDRVIIGEHCTVYTLKSCAKVIGGETEIKVSVRLVSRMGNSLF